MLSADQAPGASALPLTADDPILGMTTVARLLRVSVRTAAKLVDRSHLPGHRVPGGLARRVLRSDLVKYMRAGGLPEAWIAEASQARRAA